MADERLGLIERGLERAAERLGDITPLVMAQFYARFPDARASFVHHAAWHPERLEAEMVDNALYCAMTWFERRSEIEIIFDQSVPHHQHTLKIPPEWYGGLIGAVLDVLEPTVPGDEVEERAAWAALRAGLLDRIASNADV